MKLRPLPYRRVEATLRRAGFHPIRQRGSHVRFVHPDGRSTTVPRHAGEDIGVALLQRILADTQLDRDAFLRKT